MHVHGACYCGQVSYEGEADPEKGAVICHCTDCQATSGAPFRTVLVIPAALFRLTGKAPKTWIKTADSGNKRELGFCDECGSHIYATQAEGEKKAYNVRLGTLKERADFAPKKQIFMRSALAWTQSLNAIEKLK